MVKAKVLVDLVNQKEHIIKPGETKTIGRLGDIKTKVPRKKDEIATDPIRYRRVSRCHADLVHESDGTFYIVPRSKKSTTYIQEPSDFQEELIFQKTQIFPGYTIILGDNYTLKLEERDITSETKREDRYRFEDTQHEELVLS